MVLLDWMANYRVAVGYPVTNLENGQYMGLIGALIPFESFLSQYGNVHNYNQVLGSS